MKANPLIFAGIALIGGYFLWAGKRGQGVFAKTLYSPKEFQQACGYSDKSMKRFEEEEQSSIQRMIDEGKDSKSVIRMHEEARIRMIAQCKRSKRRKSSSDWGGSR